MENQVNDNQQQVNKKNMGLHVGIGICVACLVAIVVAVVCYQNFKVDQNEVSVVQAETEIVEEGTIENTEVVLEETIPGSEVEQSEKNVETAAEEVTLMHDSNHVWGSHYRAADGSTIYFHGEDASYEWYQDEENSDAVKLGNYKVFFGEDAKNILLTELADYYVTEDEIDNLIAQNIDSTFYTMENLTVLLMNTNSIMVGGKETLDEPYMCPYFGFSDSEFFDAANMNSGTYAKFYVVE